jgi:hypothetical protein
MVEDCINWAHVDLRPIWRNAIRTWSAKREHAKILDFGLAKVILASTSSMVGRLFNPGPMFCGWKESKCRLWAANGIYSKPGSFREARGHRMSTIHLHQTTALTPAQYIAGLTDFGPGRSKLFGNSADEYLKVHSCGPTEADVTEGSSGIWERLHYDWSDQNHVVLTTTDSNTWGGASSHTYNFTRRPDGLTDIDVVVVREGKNLKGQALGLVVGTIGKGVLETAFENSVKAIEVRNGVSREAGAA